MYFWGTGFHKEQESDILQSRKKSSVKFMYTWSLESLGIQTFQPKANSNLWSLTLQARLPWSWTFGLWRERGTFMNLKIFCICLEEFSWARAAVYRLGQKLKTDEWLVTTGRRHSWTAVVVTSGIISGLINLLLALVWDLVDVTHMGWCLNKEKSTRGNGQWYVIKVGLHRSCPFPQAWRKKREFFLVQFERKTSKKCFLWWNTKKSCVLEEDCCWSTILSRIWGYA